MDCAFKEFIKESCYFYEGEVVVETEEETVSFGAGNFVIFPKGLKCVWDIKKPVLRYQTIN